MTTGYKILQQDRAHFVTLQVVAWVDIFSRKRYRDIMVESLAFCQEKKGLEIYAWVIMSNHVHLVIQSNNDPLSNIIRDLKSFTSKRILDEIKRSPESRREWMLQIFRDAASRHQRNSVYQVWTHENHAEHVYSPQFIMQKINYIHKNPVRAGIVEEPADYLYSSARDYEDWVGLLKVEKVFMPAKFVSKSEEQRWT